LGPAHHGKAPPPRLLQFRIALLDRRGDHDDRRLADVLGPLALEEGRAEFHQPVGDLRGLRVRALHAVAERHQHLGDAGHADAANADEVDGAEFPGKLGGGGSVHGTSFASSVRASTSCTRRSVASGIPYESAARAMRTAAGGSSRTAATWPASAAASSRDSGMRIAASAATRPRALAVW